MGFYVFEAWVHLVVIDSKNQAHDSEKEEQVAPNEVAYATFPWQQGAQW